MSPTAIAETDEDVRFLETVAVFALTVYVVTALVDGFVELTVIVDPLIAVTVPNTAGFMRPLPNPPIPRCIPENDEGVSVGADCACAVAANADEIPTSTRSIKAPER